MYEICLCLLCLYLLIYLYLYSSQVNGDDNKKRSRERRMSYWFYNLSERVKSENVKIQMTKCQYRGSGFNVNHSTSETKYSFVFTGKLTNYIATKWISIDDEPSHFIQWMVNFYNSGSTESLTHAWKLFSDTFKYTWK